MTHAPDRHLRATLVGMLALVVCTACSMPKKPEPVAAPPRLVQAPGKGAVTVSEADAGASIVLERAQALVVRLPVRVTSGLEWSLVDMPPGVLAARGPAFERALRNVNIDDASGTSIWHFAPEAAGSVALNFQLRRPRNLAPAVQALVYNVTVQ